MTFQNLLRNETVTLNKTENVNISQNISENINIKKKIDIDIDIDDDERRTVKLHQSESCGNCWITKYENIENIETIFYLSYDCSYNWNTCIQL